MILHAVYRMNKVKYGGSLVKIKGRDYNGWQRCKKGCSDKKTAGLRTSTFARVRKVRPSEAKAREPYDLYLSRIVMELHNSFSKY